MQASRFRHRLNTPVFKRVIRFCKTYHCVECKRVAFESLTNTGWTYHAKKEREKKLSPGSERKVQEMIDLIKRRED